MIKIKSIFYCMLFISIAAKAIEKENIKLEQTGKSRDADAIEEILLDVKIDKSSVKPDELARLNFVKEEAYNFALKVVFIWNLKELMNF